MPRTHRFPLLARHAGAATLALAALAGAAGAAPAQRIPVPVELAPYVYQVASAGFGSYRVVVDPGFVGPGGAARIVRPLCTAQGKIPVGHHPSQVIIGNRAEDAITALSYRVHCQ